MKKVVVNRLMLGKEEIGFRFDIFENGDKLVSVDVHRENAKSFLTMIGKDNVEKGHVIRGRLVGETFVTDDESNVVSVTNKREAESVLDRYFFSQSSVDDILDITETEDEKKLSCLDNTEDAFTTPLCYDVVELKRLYCSALKACQGIPHKLKVVVYQEAEIGEWGIRVLFKDCEDALKYIFNYCILNKDNVESIVIENDTGIKFNKYDCGRMHVVNPGAKDFDTFKKCLEETTFSDEDVEICLSEFEECGVEGLIGVYIKEYIPGYDELDYADSETEVLINEYGLHIVGYNVMDVNSLPTNVNDSKGIYSRILNLYAKYNGVVSVEGTEVYARFDSMDKSIKFLQELEGVEGLTLAVFYGEDSEEPEFLREFSSAEGLNNLLGDEGIIFIFEDDSCYGEDGFNCILGRDCKYHFYKCDWAYTVLVNLE